MHCMRCLDKVWLVDNLPMLPFLSISFREHQLQSLEEAQGVQSRWELQSPQLLDGAARLCLHKVRTLQSALAAHSSRYMFTLWLQEHVGPARKVHRSLDKQLSRQRSRMSELIKELLQWVQQLRTSAQHLQAADGDDPVIMRQQVLATVGLHSECLM